MRSIGTVILSDSEGSGPRTRGLSRSQARSFTPLRSVQDDMRIRVASPSAAWRRSSTAFTLIEVMAALAIVSTAVLALLRLHLISMGTADKAQVTTRAVFLAQEKMAEALSIGYPQIGTKTGTAEVDGSSFTWRTKVTEARPPQRPRSDLGLRRLRQISVDVTWQTGRGKRQVELTTYAAESKIRE